MVGNHIAILKALFMCSMIVYMSPNIQAIMLIFFSIIINELVVLSQALYSLTYFGGMGR